ncbi:Hsp20/alpha crystallin family protein [Desulfothermus naphthae]
MGAFRFKSTDLFVEIQNMKKRADKIMEQTFGRFANNNEPTSTTWEPATDVYETEKYYVIQMEIPGVEKSDIQIELKGEELIICGIKRLIKETPRCSYMILERSYGPFIRKFSLPKDIDLDSISASMDIGILMIKLPKKEVKPDEIKIQIQFEE